MRRRGIRSYAAAVAVGLLTATACADTTEHPQRSPSTSTTVAPTTVAASVPPAIQPTSTTGAEADPKPPSITFVGTIYDEADFAALGIGKAGFWLPHFDGESAADGAATDLLTHSSLPSWIGPLNHFSILAEGDGCSADALADGCRPGFGFRTFSQDGPTSSSGGHTDWAALIAPDGVSGLSGAIVDPHTAGNTNNTVNRVQLETGVPSSFFVHVITDNTASDHDPTGTIRLRANIGLEDLDNQVEPDVILGPCNLVFNGVPDIYTFRVDGFAAEDYLKLRFSGTPDEGGASFGGFLIDEVFDDARSVLSPEGNHGSNPLCQE